MKLPDYLRKRGITQTEFGRRLNPPMTQMHLSHLVNGRSRITLARALEIEAVTGGEVPVTEWITPVEMEVLRQIEAGHFGANKDKNALVIVNEAKGCVRQVVSGDNVVR